MTRRWIKVWVQESLTGTVRFEFTPAERCVWYDLLVLAGNCRQDGIIAAGPGIPYPHTWIAGTLNIPLALLEITLKKCLKAKRIRENSDGIYIINWSKYQSEYERQKPYRTKPKEHSLLDPLLAAQLAFRGVEYKKRRKELGRELTTEERVALFKEIDKRLEKKYGRTIKDALAAREEEMG